MDKKSGALGRRLPGDDLPGIVVADGRQGGVSAASAAEPRILAFIWGGKVRPSPTLPYGRWRGAA